MKSPPIISKLTKLISRYYHSAMLVIAISVAAIFELPVLIYPDAHENSRVMIGLILLGASAAALILIEILNEIRREPLDDTEESLSDRLKELIDVVVRRSRKDTSEPLHLRMSGMRLSGIEQVVRSLAAANTSGRLGHRSLVLNIYHIDPDFYAKEHDDHFTPTGGTQIGKMAQLKGRVSELSEIFVDDQNIDINFFRFKSFPQLWILDIDSNTIGWGFFTWDRARKRWSGPENHCYISSVEKDRDRLMVKYLLNRLDSLEDWSDPN